MNIFGNNEGYKEFFFVLCDIGLICLRNPKEDVPKLIIPIIGSSVNVNINPMVFIVLYLRILTKIIVL